MRGVRSPQYWIGCGGIALSLFLSQFHGVPVAQAQERSAEDEYHYDPSNKRDPFFSPLHRVTETPTVPDEAKTPLQRLDLGQFKLVGVILDIQEPKALIEDN